ncbi:unnamed protein product [Lactuca virosa]|uniref:DNA-directed RNA polymerase n=1 Tax=Lactuca virosa TaxID=75947 RepID=A0AAU9NH28_9ASTR|nr:unnamed protein product [Lactuca virosa]
MQWFKPTTFESFLQKTYKLKLSSIELGTHNQTGYITDPPISRLLKLIPNHEFFTNNCTYGVKQQSDEIWCLRNITFFNFRVFSPTYTTE